MKTTDTDKLELMKEYLAKNIVFHRTRAEEYREADLYKMAMIAEAKASELNCTLAYLLGVMYDEI